MHKTKIIRDVSEIVDLIIDEKQIVGMFQGKGEWGPRALGNRSILFDPTNHEAKQIVNDIKKREIYRPFAGSVMAEHANEYFDMKQLPDSPWMSFAIQAREIAYEKIPSIVHADGTCRIQTVTVEQNKNYYNLIKTMYEKNGVPIVFNTSFNLGGEALVETIYDAIDTCNRTEINYLYIPEDQDINIPYELIKIKENDNRPEDE
jgi:carbamoyltransferase|tara:strand:- start:1118 stop:1729 length:612 start_codon:yes stop_codon:yes gene_type:complete